MALNADGTIAGPFPLRNEIDGFSLAEAAMRWSYLVARRQQWSDAGKDVLESTAKARHDLAKLGVTDAMLDILARAKVIQICIPWKSEEDGWPARVLPWEFLIILALRGRHPGLSTPTIVRHLEVPELKDASPRVQPTQAVAVIACPGEKTYAATKERYLREIELIRDHLMDPLMTMIQDPDASGLQSKITDLSGPKDSLVMHFLGVAEVRKTEEAPHEPRPHLWLPGGDGGWLEFRRAAEFLAGTSDRHPRLITFSFRDTGPRLAAMAVAAGAHAAIGFQDQVTNQVSESFYSLFYQRWRQNGWDLCDAFSHARKKLSSKLRGTGIVLWSRHPLIQESPAPPKQRTPHSTRGFKPTRAGDKLGKFKSAAKLESSVIAEPELDLEKVGPSRAADAGIIVTAVAAPTLNYSVLHNQQGAALLEGMDPNGTGPLNAGGIAPIRLFSKFSLQRSPRLSPNTAVEVEVTLYAGDDQCTWRQLEVLDTPSKDVSAQIRVPLTSTLARTLRESLRTTVETSVLFQGNIVHRMSHAVTLLAIDEWRDDGVCHVFLPSFVLPRDPAVIEIVRVARRCLCALTDDFSAGFDGYQRGDVAMVDLQVRAIWAALVQEWQLGYINPPPSFSKCSQRLRSPSAILRERAGTCIDLAILLAACLEYIDIHPFIVLCPGHAYVGYCRVDRGHDERLIPVQHSELVVSNTEVDPGFRPTNSSRILPPWVYDRDYHRALVRELEAGRVVAIEATGLTQEMPFNEACRIGAKTLRKRMEFDCVIDVFGARAPGHDVTPLPMIFSP